MINKIILPLRALFISRTFAVSYGYAYAILHLMDMVDDGLSVEQFACIGCAIQDRYPEDAAHARMLAW